MYFLSSELIDPLQNSFKKWMSVFKIQKRTSKHMYGSDKLWCTAPPARYMLSVGFFITFNFSVVNIAKLYTGKLGKD